MESKCHESKRRSYLGNEKRLVRVEFLSPEESGGDKKKPNDMHVSENPL